MTTILGRQPMSQMTGGQTNSISEFDSAFSKIIVFGVIGTIFSFLFGLFSKFFILNPSWGLLIFTLLFAIGFLSFFLLNTLFIKAFWINGLIILGNATALLLAFYDNFSFTVLLGALIAFLFLIRSNSAGRLELENMMKIRFSQIGQKILPKAITGLAIFVSVAYIGIFAPLDNFIFSKGAYEIKEFFISRQSFEKTVLPLDKLGFMKNFLPGFDLSLPVGEVIKNMAVAQIEGNSKLKLLPDAMKKPLIKEASQESEKQLVNLIGSPVNMKSKISDVLYDWLVVKFSGLSDTSKALVSIGVALTIFLTIITFSWPIRLAVSFFAYIFCEICLALGFSVKLTEQRSKEIIILK